MLTLCQNLTLPALPPPLLLLPFGLQRGGYVMVLNIRLGRCLAKHHARESNSHTKSLVNFILFLFAFQSSSSYGPYSQGSRNVTR